MKRFCAIAFAASAALSSLRAVSEGIEPLGVLFVHGHVSQPRPGAV